MNFSELTVGAAEQAAATTPDYTPAIIGFVGVVAGGFMQAGFAWRKSRGDTAMEMRRQVTNLRHEADMYLSFVAKLVRLSNERELATLSKEPLLGPELSKRYRAVLEAGFALTACPDNRVSQQASVIVEAIKEFASEHQMLERYRPDKWPSRDPIDVLLNALLNMVVPRWHERLHRFRNVG